MKQKDLQKAEFWIATILYCVAIIILISNTGDRRHSFEYYRIKNEGLTFSYLYNYFLPKLFEYSVIYFGFLSINFLIIPPLIKKQQNTLNGILLFGLLVVMGLVISISKTYSSSYILVEYDDIQSAYNRIFFKGFSSALWIIISISGYVLLKEFISYLIEDNKKIEGTQNQIKVDIGFGLAFWFVGLLLWVSASAPFEIMIIWTLVILASIGIFVYALYFYLPKHYARAYKFRRYFWQIMLATVLSALPVCLITLLMVRQEEFGAIVLCFHFPTQIIITLPLAWYIYKSRLANSNQISTLRTELGKSDASLSFLQSQINPHFLFNALNTLYGTALQENAERTGEGIQKLGDMMRFMLHENVQDKISLTRDVDYLENYIALQKLRTSRSADIVIDTQIDEQLNNFQIAPMLLIPFVENAFKHGISLQQPSHIKVTLQTKENTLYFDVHNSIHIKPDNDPEKLKSGIGLVNVKQRLALLYPGKHELIIRESAKEFFIHLTIQL
ncbi:sensor histidine kinase [Pedobacter polaris]|uniref:Sensor histidine kinase n=1 Tax=Pedobacter polaris TaxID=2571273 RepID=A0A4U1CEB7_9SPHI|nr:histidine kinase [Pedobacter polaris]TKC05402.1 sensor histidine kinase [Pedobacter polaris]